jgi:hypothetical protein
VKLKNEARQLNSLTPPVLIEFYIDTATVRLFVGGSSNKIGIDVDLAPGSVGEASYAGPSTAASILCPGGMTSSLTRPTLAAYPAAGSHGSGRDSPAKSGVGEPFEGAVTLKEREMASAAAAPAPAPTTGPTDRRTAPPPDPYAPTVQYVHAVTGDGKFHSLYVSNAEEPNPPIPFLPPNANALGLIVLDNTAYVATVNGCGGVENGVWALNLKSKKVTHWKSSGEVAGSAGFAVGPDGTLYVATGGGELAALEAGTLVVKSSYKAGRAFTSSPVVFDYKGKDLIAMATSDGQV